jgi:ATP-dependent Clp protease ATP-binding subunit ClpA
MQDRLSAEARAVMRLALAESEQLGHGYLGDEHVLLGLLAEQASAASSLLRGHGLDLASARAELQRLSAAGLMPRSCADDAGARRGRRHLTQLGWTIGPVNPASALLQAYGVDTIRLRSELDRMS